MAEIKIYSDFVCPYCLLAEHVVSEAIGDRDIKIRWQAFELRPEPVPTLRPEDPYLPTIWARSVYPLADRLGVPIQLPSISPQPRTAKAFEVLVMAEDQGLAHPFAMRVMRAFFQEDQNIGDVEILVTLGEEVGLNGADIRAALSEGRYRARHREALRHAEEDMAITSVPTLVIGHHVFRGTPPLDALKAALDELVDTQNPAITAVS